MIEYLYSNYPCIKNLDIDKLPQEIVDYFKCVEPSFPWYLPTSSPEIALPILKNALLYTYPFQIDDIEAIKGCPKKPAIPHYQDREELIENLADELQIYTSKLENIGDMILKKQEYWRGVWEEIYSCKTRIESLRKKKRALPQGVKKIHTGRIKEAFAIIGQVVSSSVDTFLSEDMETTTNRARFDLCIAIVEVFNEYVPKATNKEIYFATASIVSHFDIETGHIKDIEERIRKRHERSSHNTNSDS